MKTSRTLASWSRPTGFALALARAVGEYGSVIFIAGNIPMKTEIAPLLIVIKLEEFNYDGATAIGLAMLVISFALLFVINAIMALALGNAKVLMTAMPVSVAFMAVGAGLWAQGTSARTAAASWPLPPSTSNNWGGY